MAVRCPNVRKTPALGEGAEWNRPIPGNLSVAGCEGGSCGEGCVFGAQIKFVDEVETGKVNNLVQIYESESGSPADKAGLIADVCVLLVRGRGRSGR